MTGQTLITDRLSLREPVPGDWAAYARFMATEAARFFKGYKNPTEAWKSFGMIRWHWEDLGFGPWAVTAKNDDQCIGIVGPKKPPHWPEGELTWIVFEGAEGKGIAAEATLAARTDAYDRLGWPTVVSYIEDANTRSVALAQRLGCTCDADAPVPGGPVKAWRHPGPEVAA
ncbi:MAG: GNAT family N-acetyltransferase [Pseudomonadota bacterium]